MTKLIVFQVVQYPNYKEVLAKKIMSIKFMQTLNFKGHVLVANASKAETFMN